LKGSPEPLEILEAGTGHGSVTLHLARAIQAANPPVPNLDMESGGSSVEESSETALESGISGNQYTSQIWQDWRNSRRAIVHSVELSSTYSKHAERKIISGFRRGLYWPHIEFHVANVKDWIDSQLEQRNNTSFLNYVFLDMPSSHRYLRAATNAMRENALIAIFVPSITQIGECIREIKANALPLRMEKALELGEGISNGRLWDVRLAFKRAKDPVEQSEIIVSMENDVDESIGEDIDTQGETSVSTSEDDRSSAISGVQSIQGVSEEEPVMICRPKVGERVIGGGFVGLWRRIPSQ
jgi:hypothetical protein